MPQCTHFVRRRQSHARNSLIKATGHGAITFVLGAGVSITRGIPSWENLVTKLWSESKPAKPIPSWLESPDPLPHPLAYQILLEEIEGATRREIAQQNEIHADDVDPIDVDQRMIRKLSDRLYTSKPIDIPDDTMGVLIDLLRQEQKSERNRIARVITFNADDLLERGANKGSTASKPVVFPVPRGSFHPRYDECAFGFPPINIFHLHGFIPWSRRYGRGSQDTLVFTDAQYWESIANPSSFANRVMGNALQDSNCVFVGLSMTDVNIMRWLGLRHAEFVADRASHYTFQGKSRSYAYKKTRDAINRHFWICTGSADPTRFIASHLERRGVTTIVLPSWGKPFAELINDCFPRMNQVL